MSKAKGGKRRPYTMSPKARAQRRAAAWRHGGRSGSALAQVVHPCKRSLCPMSDPNEKGNCSIVREAELRNLAVDHCPVPLVVNEEVRAKFVEAIRKGEYDGLAELTGTLFAGMSELSRQELGKLLKEGLTTEYDIFGPDNQMGTGVKTNPRAEPLLKILEMLGVTATQQAITPKAAGERKRDEGIGGLLDLYKRRSALAGAGGEAG